jgi:hypothetical protein
MALLLTTITLLAVTHSAGRVLVVYEGYEHLGVAGVAELDQLRGRSLACHHPPARAPAGQPSP